jgi:hypothetical protein
VSYCAGCYKIIYCGGVGGGGGGLSRQPGQEVINKTHYTSIRPKELSAHHPFS